jgi:Tfp pilus assembly protein PilV
MKNKEFYKLLKKNKSNSGFTLTELLVGLFMSIFVIGALGFGLMTVLATSQSENSKVKARTENSRALDFISDEVRRARTIQSFANNTNAPSFTTTSKTVVLALDIPEISDSATIDTDNNATTKTERVVYYLKSTALGSWKGPQVLYRWGPPLNADGSYGTGTWSAQALIDGINNTTVSSPCATGTVSPATPTGFYACITGTNTAQLFLTGQTKTASGRYDDSQTNDSQVVARARDTLADKTDTNTSVTWAVEGIGDALNCGGTQTWDMRTDFSNDVQNRETQVSDPNKNVTWIRTPGSGSKQPQPITINPDNPLEITSTAQGGGCTSTAPEPISHKIDFKDPRTFNGDHKTDTLQNSSNVKEKDGISAHERVHFFKQGFNIPTEYKGYDANQNGEYEEASGDQRSLGRFLYEKGLAIPVGNPVGDPDLSTTTFKLPTREDLQAYLESSDLESFFTSKHPTWTDAQKQEYKNKFKVLGNDQRIIAFEVGQTSPKLADGTTNNPGFDLQDNIFVVTSDVFKTKFKPSCFSDGNCNPSTGEPNP